MNEQSKWVSRMCGPKARCGPHASINIPLLPIILKNSEIITLFSYHGYRLKTRLLQLTKHIMLKGHTTQIFRIETDYTLGET